MMGDSITYMYRFQWQGYWSIASGPQTTAQPFEKLNYSAIAALERIMTPGAPDGIIYPYCHVGGVSYEVFQFLFRGWYYPNFID